MNARSSPGRYLLIFAAPLALAACSKGGPGRISAPGAPIAPSEIEAVQQMLLGGDEKAANKRIKALLEREPMNAPLMVLRQSITEDPEELLGPTSYPYTVRSGDTISSVSERLLGNSLKAYQLARYNDLDAPVTLVPGQTLRIPGAPSPRKPQLVPSAPTRPEKPSPSTAAKLPEAAKPKPAAPKISANPAAAQQARAAGLAALNRGSVGQAVGLLQRAQSLDPGNALIKRDLERAQRISKTVRSRK